MNQNISADIMLLDFSAPWCGSCKQLTPIIDQITEEYRGRVTVTKVNVDEDATTAAKYDVMSIPTLIILKDGQPVERITGAVAKEAIKRKLDQALAG